VKTYHIPARLNLGLAGAQLALMLGIFWAAAQVTSWWAVALLSLAYGIVMNSGYALLHEAEHGILHPHRGVNDCVGTVLALFFPAPFHLIRQGHLGHHIRNRSDDEAFDLYFDDESRFLKCVQLYGTLTGLFWALIYVSNFFVLFRPSLVLPARVNRTTEAFLESLNPRYRRLIQAEAFAAIALHAGLIWLWHIPLAHYFAVMFGFGFLWSSMQYAHHYGAERDVLKGARNLRTFGLLDLIWLNHNWHRNHHTQPTIPWVYLPLLAEPRERRGSLLEAYFTMWRGPQAATERIENRFAGKVIR
jgi:fatty acid desaturase